MAKYRHIHTTFWSDPKVAEEFTPDDRYFYLYLLTNPHSTQIGIYNISKKMMAFELGYSMDTVSQLIQRFTNYHKLIAYNEASREIAIINWGKYNLNKGGKPILDCVTKELKEVKDENLIKSLMASIQNEPIFELFKKEVQNRKEITKMHLDAPKNAPAFAPMHQPSLGKMHFDAPRMHQECTKNAPAKNALHQLESPTNQHFEENHESSHESSTISGQKEKEKEKKDIVHFTPNAPNSFEVAENEFNQFWNLYPNKKDKLVARNKFNIARKKHSLEVILLGTSNYIKECEKEQREAKFIKMAKTFLHQESFLEFQALEPNIKKPSFELDAFKPIKQNAQETNSGGNERWTNTKDTISTKIAGSGLL